jgi:exoenzyme U
VPSDSLEYDDYVRTVFGFDPSAAKGGSKAAKVPSTPGGKPAALSPADPGSPVSEAAGDPKVWTNAVGPALTRQGPGRPGARIKAPAPVGHPAVCKGPGGKEVTVAKTSDGRVALTRDPPPITEITFSGGGGKGAALPGAVKALSESGVLKGTKQIHGASVGSMTAAMIAAGITPEAFQKLSDDTKFGPLIKGEDKLMINVSGDGLEDLVRTSMNSSLNAQIAKFAEAAMKSGQQVDPKTIDTLKAMTDKFSKGAGPTFGDLRILSKIIPDIKEVVITGTLIGKSDRPGPSRPPGKVKDCKPEMTVFSADTQPDMEVARAVHASAALPPVFKPVEIPLASGEIGKFEDGGVLNNAPTSDSLGTDRGVDPVPETGKMTFVFEEDASHEILQGKATPDRSRVNDTVAGAENSAADFAKNRGLADRPEEVVMVPLKFETPDGKKKDFSTFMGGTVNFDIAKDDKLKLQSLTKEATEAHLEKRKEKETRAFDSVPQMFMCTTKDDLAAMAASDYPGAKDALKFRGEVEKNVAALEALAGQGKTAADKKVQALLQAMDQGAAGDQERVGYIGRALNRSGKLDAFLAGAKKAKGGPKLEALEAGVAVNGVLEAKKTAQRILKEVVYPKMVREGPKGVTGRLLEQMDTSLRDARSNADINRALRMGIPYFQKKFDAGGLLGLADFARALTANLQPEP